jgi:hypothetical protein
MAMSSSIIRSRLIRGFLAAFVLAMLALPFTSLRASAAIERIAAPSSVTGGRSITIRVELDRPAYSGGFLILLYSSSSLIPVPGYIAVPGGQDYGSVTVKTGTTTVDKAVTITAKSGATTVSKVITVKKPYLYKLVVQTTYPEGQTGYITAKISGPAPSGGVTIYFYSSRPSIITVPTSAQIPAGYSSVRITVKPAMVPYNVAVNLSASYSGIKITWPTTVTNGP